MASSSLALVPHEEKERQPLLHKASSSSNAKKAASDRAQLQSDLTGDPTMTPLNVAMMVGYVSIILVQSATTREVLKDTKVLSQSLVAAVGVCAVILYGCLSIFMANNPWAEWEYVDPDTGSVERVRDFKRNLRRALYQTFEPKKLMMYFPSAVFFSLNQTFILMGPIFVGGGLKNMLSQVKIPLSVMGSWVILGKVHNTKQWACIVMLLCGVIMFGIVQKEDLGGSGSSSGEWTKMFLGFLVIFLGSAFAVAGGLLQELYMKREKETSIFTQKFQTDLSQLGITLILLWAGPYIGRVLDSGQTNVPMLAGSKPENVEMKQDIATWKATVVNVKDVHFHAQDLYAKEFGVFDAFYTKSQVLKQFEQSRQKCTDLACCEDGKDCCDYELLDEDEEEGPRKSCKMTFMKKSDQTKTIQQYADRRKLDAASKLKALAKKMENLSKDVVLSPFEPSLRMLSPTEWRDKIAVGGQGQRELESLEFSRATKLNAMRSEKEGGSLVVYDIRGVYQRVKLVKGNLGDTAWCAFNTQDMGRKVREEPHQKKEGNVPAARTFFEVRACVVRNENKWKVMLSTDRLLAARLWRVTGKKSGKKETHVPELSVEKSVTTFDELTSAGFIQLAGKGVDDFLLQFEDVEKLDCDADVHECINEPKKTTEPILIPNLEEFGGEVLRFSEGRKGLQSKTQDTVFAEDLKYGAIEDMLEKHAVPILLEVRRGPLAPGVEYSSSHNEIKPSHSFVCDNLRCNRKFFKGYPYLMQTTVLTSKKWVGDAGEAAEKGYFNANSEETMYQSGPFAGWSMVILLAVGATMMQYFMNALINKYISVVWNKVCHSAATVLSFWVGEMLLNKDPQSEVTGIKLIQLIILSVLIFTVVMLFVASKEDAKKEKTVEGKIVVEGTRL